MRKVIFVLLVGMSVQCLGQVFPKSDFSKEELLVKSKSQKKTGFLLIGGGLVTALGGGILAFSSQPNSGGEAIGTGMFFLGVGSMAGGLVMLVISSHNQDRAEELRLGITPIELLPGTYAGPPAIPSMTFAIPLKGRN